MYKKLSGIANSIVSENIYKVFRLLKVLFVEYTLFVFDIAEHFVLDKGTY